MRTLYIEGLAIHGGPESCVGDPVRAQRSVDRGRAGGAIEPRNPKKNQGADVFLTSGRQHRQRRFREPLADPARSKNPGTHDELHAREPGDLVVARTVGGDAPSWVVRGVADQRWAGREGNA
jgi:hypothetical protein